MNTSTQPTYDVIFSYQGAFGPPTFGHLKSMEMFAEKILSEYSNTKILMLFMPTALSSSKPHLEPTQDDRIEVLNKFSEILNATYPDNNITFEASKIEYELCAQNISTATIRTIDKLKEIYPTPSIILLGMGKDNILQLPYWEKIREYAVKVTSIYVVNRELSKAENNIVANFSITQQPGTTLPFQKILPWQKSKEDIQDIFGITGLDNNGTYEKGIDVTTINQGDEPHINIKLPNIVMLGTPPPTSSSMLRYYIYKYIIEVNEEVKNEIKEQIKNIMFGQYRDNIDKLIDQTIENYTNREPSYKFCISPKNDDYEDKYNAFINNNGFMVGGKRSKTNRKKSNKKNKTRKNKTRKNKNCKNSD